MKFIYYILLIIGMTGIAAYLYWEKYCLNQKVDNGKYELILMDDEKKLGTGELIIELKDPVLRFYITYPYVVIDHPFEKLHAEIKLNDLGVKKIKIRLKSLSDDKLIFSNGLYWIGGAYLDLIPGRKNNSLFLNINLNNNFKSSIQFGDDSTSKTVCGVVLRKI